MTVRIIHGDMREKLAELQDASIDAIVTDPPYGLSFMGKGWDRGIPTADFWRPLLRVAKPGAHLLAFSSSRTFHRMWCAVEDAGWEIRDTLMWLHGVGFPKSSNQHGEWGGWGTALKPAFEPILMARKPLMGTVAANLEAHRVGALNIDACRVESAGRPLRVRDAKGGADGAVYGEGFGNGSKASGETTQGRWPANVLHDGSEEVVAAFPESNGQQGDVRGTEPSSPFRNCYGEMNRTVAAAAAARGDRGSAARFFCARRHRASTGMQGWKACRRAMSNTTAKR